MTMVDLNSHIKFDLNHTRADSWGGQNARTLDASGEKYTYVLQAPKTGNITKVYFLSQTVTVAGTIDLTCETVDSTTGNPTGTLYGTGASGSVLVNASNTQFSVTLSTPLAITRGALFCVVLTLNGAGNINISNDAGNSYTGFPYNKEFLTGSWVTQNNNNPLFMFEYDDGTFPNQIGANQYTLGLPTNASESFSSSSNPNHRGNVFKPAFKCTVSGVYLPVAPGSGTTLTIKLYDTDATTVLATALHQGNLNQNAAVVRARYYAFSTNVTCSANSEYRLVYAPGTQAVSLQAYQAGSSSILGGYADGIQLFSTTSITAPISAGQWTNNTLKVYSIYPVLSQINDFSQSGGSTGVASGKMMNLMPNQLTLDHRR